jgi:hypothetical protein
MSETQVQKIATYENTTVRVREVLYRVDGETTLHGVEVDSEDSPYYLHVENGDAVDFQVDEEFELFKSDVRNLSFEQTIEWGEKRELEDMDDVTAEVVEHYHNK